MTANLPPLYKPPSGNCDMCNTRPALHWFGQTGVALCGEQECAEKNQRKFNDLMQEIDPDMDEQGYGF